MALLHNVQVIVSGFLHVLAGAVIGGAVSWFAANILQDYYNITIPGDLKYVYGEALFVGWVRFGFDF